jgi:parallel beta-helix repeat protein
MNGRTVSWIMFTLLFTGIFISAVNIQPVFANLPVHNINTDEYFETIQDAINAPNTTNGHTIQVDAGVYNEDLIVNKGVWLKGENRSTTTISGTGTKIVVDVTTSNFTMSGFTINNSETGEPCIYTESQNLTVENCRIINRYIGIYLESSSHVNITNNIIIGGTYAGVALVRSDHVSITYNKIANGLNRTHGIDINGSATITVVYNNISDNINGVFLCNGEGDYGDIIISNNYIANNTNGIEISLMYAGISSAIIVDNTITNNERAVLQVRWEGAGCSPHNFYHNNFINNTNNNITFWGAAIAHNWDDGYPSGGNYWSNYNGTDVHSGPGWDGIGDAAYSVGQNNSDNYPAINPWPLAHLQVHTFATEQGEIEDVSVWVDGTEPCQNSTAYFLLKYETYSVKVRTSFSRQDPQDPTKYYRYYFDHWEDGSTQNPRTITLTAERVLTAYYRVQIMYVEAPPRG